MAPARDHRARALPRRRAAVQIDLFRGGRRHRRPGFAFAVPPGIAPAPDVQDLSRVVHRGGAVIPIELPDVPRPRGPAPPLTGIAGVEVDLQPARLDLLPGIEDPP